MRLLVENPWVVDRGRQRGRGRTQRGMAEHAVLYVNGRRRVLPADRARQTLLSYLREDCGLTGSKLGCGEGGCGACTVTLCHWDAEKAAPVYKSVNACLAPLYSVVGMHIVTVEGIGSTRSGLHPVQQKLACAHGSQCGFCTPGFVMSMYTQLRAREPGVTLQEHEIESNLAGNLCRCTGYRPILEGFRAFAATPSSSVDADAQVDPLTGVKELPLLPEELRAPPQPLNLSGATTWHRPVTLEAMLELKRDLPEAKVICGNTEVGIEVMIKGLKFPQIIAGTHVPELRAVVQTDAGVMLGSSITLSELEAVCKQQIAARPDHETQSFHAVLRQLHWFAGRQIRNVSSLAGNIVTGSPISDLNPLWSALNATFICQSAARGRRSVSATEFWTGYRKNLLAPDELLVAVFVPATRRFEYVKEFKQSHRRDDDIAIVNAGMRVAFEQDGADSFVVKDLSCAYGGMAATTKLATGVADAAPGLPWQDSTLQALLKSLHDDMALPPDVPGGMPEYREALSASFFFKFFVYAATSLERDAGGAYTSDLIPTDRLAANAGEREPSRGCQYYGKGKDGEQVGLPLVHASAHLQVSGEAQYNDDLSDSADTLHAALVMSEKPHARISVNFSPAEAADGVVGCYSAKDVPGDNHIGAVVHDEEIFATDTVTCVGQIIGIVVADTKEHADAAARLVKVDYDELPAVLSIEDAIEAESYFEYEGVTGHVLRRGDVEAGFSQCDHVVEGQVRCGGQEHFYLEPSACVVVPLENNEIHTVVSTQCVDKSQRLIASALGIACSKVVARSKRIGGGFGGKETRAAFINVAAAVAAYCCQKPVRLVLDRHVDMAITGQRHAFVGKYKVGCTAEGRILSLKIDLYNNAGNSLDLSQAIMDRALFHADGSYAIANMEIVGHVCRYAASTARSLLRDLNVI